MKPSGSLHTTRFYIKILHGARFVLSFVQILAHTVALALYIINRMVFITDHSSRGVLSTVLRRCV
jgi:hypothetical protein